MPVRMCRASSTPPLFSIRRTLTGAAALAFMACLGGVPSAEGSAPKSKHDYPVISSVVIRGTDIYDFERQPGLQTFPYNWINMLHIQTKEHIIRQELLLREGDMADPFLVEETERNLRALSYIRTSEVRTRPNPDGTETLLVDVSDSWTTEPQLNLGGLNKVDEIEVGFREKNLLGLGKTVDGFYSTVPGSVKKTYRYLDPNVFGSRFRFEAKTDQGTLGRGTRLQLDRPFFSARTPWSGRVTHEDRMDRVDVFTNNVRTSRYKKELRVTEQSISRKLGESDIAVPHAGLRYRIERQRFFPTADTNPATPLPSRKDLHTFFLDVDFQENRFIEMTRIDKMTRIEDIRTGVELNISPGFSPANLSGGRDTTFFGTSARKKWLIRGRDLFSTELAFSERNILKRSENTRHLAAARYHHLGFPGQTLVANLRVESGQRLDPENMIVLGNDNGLRAFKINQFVGERSFVFNLEDRFFFVDEVASLFSLGAAAFYDAGYAWPRGQAVSMGDVKSAIGAGLRIGLTRSANEVVLRLDVAYRLQRVHPGDPRVVVTFGTGQAF